MPIRVDDPSQLASRPTLSAAQIAVALAISLALPVLIVRVKPLQVQWGDWRLEVGASATGPVSWSSPASFGIHMKDCSPSAHVANLRAGEAAWYVAYGQWHR